MDRLTANIDKTAGTTRTDRLVAAGINAASRYLNRQGFEILETGWECEHGAVDLIARDNDDLVFIEVKTRSTRDTGLPEEAVSGKKRARYEKVAISYLSAHDFSGITVRFDVVSILALSEERAFLRLHRDAFAV